MQRILRVQGTCWLLAILDGPPEDGIVGAEIRVSGFPSAWFGAFTANSQAGWVQGNPLNQGGSITFGSCQRGTRRILELGRFNFFATSQESFTLQVVAPILNSNPSFSCPVVALCDETDRCASGLFVPKFTQECVEGLTAYVNGGSCTVDVEEHAVAGRRLAIGPNPAVGGVTLGCDLSAGRELVFEIFDIAGRRVRRLGRRAAVPGHHTVFWNGRDEAGRTLPSGLYFVQLLGPEPLRGRLTLLR